MKKLMLIQLYLLLIQYCFAQKDFSKFDVVFTKYRVDSNDNFNIQIKLKSQSTVKITIPLKPLVTDFSDENGALRFRLENIIDSSFNLIDVMKDYFPPNLDSRKRVLSKNTSFSYQYNLESLYFFRRGRYRVKAFLTYLKKRKPFQVESDWVYFEVISDIFSSHKKE